MSIRTHRYITIILIISTILTLASGCAAPAFEQEDTSVEALKVHDSPVVDDEAGVREESVAVPEVTESNNKDIADGYFRCRDMYYKDVPTEWIDNGSVSAQFWAPFPTDHSKLEYADSVEYMAEPREATLSYPLYIGAEKTPGRVLNLFEMQKEFGELLFPWTMLDAAIQGYVTMTNTALYDDSRYKSGKNYVCRLYTTDEYTRFVQDTVREHDAVMKGAFSTGWNCVYATEEGRENAVSRVRGRGYLFVDKADADLCTKLGVETGAWYYCDMEITVEGYSLEEKGDMTITQALFFGEWAKADEDEAELAEHLKLLQCDNWEEQFST